MSDQVVARHEVTDLAGRGRVNLLHFHPGTVLMIAATAVGLYRNPEAVNDPLGNGLIGYEAIPEPLQGDAEAPDGQVREHQAGYVRLASGGIIFIRPDGVGLYPDTDAALNNRDMYWLIPFEADN